MVSRRAFLSIAAVKVLCGQDGKPGMFADAEAYERFMARRSEGRYRGAQVVSQGCRCCPKIENRGRRREAGWESGKPVFGFPLFQPVSPALWECGNLAVWARFPRSWGRRGKPGFGFPRVP